MNAKQLGKRLLQIVLVALGISFLTFLITCLAPGDPVRTMFAATGMMPSEEVVQETREAMCLMLLVAVPIGMAQATHKNSVVDYALRGITFFGVSMPNFWVGLLLMLFFCVRLQLLPVVSSGGDLKSLVLPSITLAFAMSAKYTRQVRTAILEELNQDYVTGARARGVKEWKILWMNVFPNSLLPLITMLGLSHGSLLGGTAVVEVIFSYPGMGSLAVAAITAYDYPLIQGYVLWISLIYMLVNLAVDISYSSVDPRMREGRQQR